MAQQIKAVVFDAYGTLFDVYSVEASAERMFAGQGKALAQLWRDKQIEYTRLRTMSARHADFWTITGDALAWSCERLGLALQPQQREQLMRQYESLVSFPENLAALRLLRERGFPLGILSNGTPAMLQSAIAAAGMDGLFAHVLSVESVGKFKTAPEVYQLAPDAFRCAARDILFVSSNGWDACGATWFGFTTLWLNRAGLPAERLGVTPTTSGRSMQDVVAYLSP